MSKQVIKKEECQDWDSLSIEARAKMWDLADSLTYSGCITARLIRREDIDRLVGKAKTFIDSLGFEVAQSKAVKDVIGSIVWDWFKQEDMGGTPLGKADWILNQAEKIKKEIK